MVQRPYAAVAESVMSASAALGRATNLEGAIGSAREYTDLGHALKPSMRTTAMTSNRVEIVMPYRVGFNQPHEHHSEFAAGAPVAVVVAVAADPRDGVE